MRLKYILALFGMAGFYAPSSSQPPTSTQNYTMHRVMLDGDGTVGVTEVQYYDGIGRPTVGVSNANGNGTNFTYRLQEYDTKGRASKYWLPVAGSSSPDYMDVSPLQSAAMGRDGVPYSETVYDALDRPTENWGAGEAWRNAGRRVQITRRSNTANEVRRYTVNASGHLTSSGYHPAGTLTVEETTDEDNRMLTVYKNVAGHTLLERRSTDNNTHFVYNDLDQLQYVLSPMASNALNSNGTWNITSNPTLQRYAYHYEYDSRGRCIKKKLPGCDAILCQYDKADRIVFTRDGNQQQNGTGTFYLYDRLGREAVRGICQAAGFPDTDNLLARAFLQTGGTYAGYSTTLSLPALVQLLVVNYYDTYSQMPDSASLPFVTQSGYATGKSDAHGLLTGKRVYQLGSASVYFPSVYFYDAKGQEVLSRTQNARGGIDDTFTQYSFTGKPVKKFVCHRSGTQLNHTEEYAYTYDSVDRIKKVMHTVDGGTPVKIAEYTYNNQGLVSHKSNAGTNISYTYNLRNWLTGTESVPFTEYLYYEDAPGGATSQYGGNVSTMKWFAYGNSGGEERGYNFGYDGLSRLVLSAYFSDYGDEDYAEHYGYDANGNINDLYRAGLSYDGTYNRIDDVTYYYNGNQMVQVYENADDPDTYGLFHFYDGCLDDGDEFQYDRNGNMTKDLNRGISSIDYNVLNQPQSIHYNDYSSISNTYNAEGEKLFRLTLINNNGWPAPIGNLTPPNITSYVTQYCGNMVYNSQGNQSTNEYLLIDGGYVTFEGTTPKYHFYVQDHLGNNRAVVSQTGAVEQQAQYYPSGAIMTDISSGLSQQPYLYSGKELDRMHELDWYDYGARHYDAALLRWHTVDPLCEKYYHISPYAFCANNFANMFDLDGMDWVKREYDGKDEYYFDREVRSAEAFNKKYGAQGNMSYITDGTKITLDGSDYVFSNEGNGSVSIDGTKKEDYPILYGDKYTIFGTADESCNGETVHRNLMGTSYTGGNNPKDYNNHDSYQYFPNNISEMGSMIHDKIYDKYDAKGALHAFLNTNSNIIKADLNLANYNALNMINLQVPMHDRLRSFATAVLFYNIVWFKMYLRINNDLKTLSL